MPVAPDHTGRLIARRYRLEAVIGEGGFGRVYRAVDQHLDTQVAVKIINPWWAQDPEWAERFAQEARTAAGIGHPGVVRVMDAGTDRTVGPYSVAELIDGESVRELLDREGTLSPGRAANLIGQAADALAAAHERGIVHRDIKPANLLIDRGGRLRVCDFGIARLQSGATKTSASHTLIGTPTYMAPEQARGKATGPPADQYALGVVLYEMLAGRPPYDGDTPVEIALAHLSDEAPELPAGIPADLRSAVRRAMAKQPADRYPSISAFAHAIRGLAASPGTSATSAQPTRRAPRGPRTAATALATPARRGRRRVLIGCAVATFVVVALAVAGVLTAELSPTRPPRSAGASDATGPTTTDNTTQPPNSTGGSDSPVAPALASVPSVVGLSTDGARARLKRHGLAFAAVHHRSVRQPAGRIVSQRPASGRHVPDGATVHVTVSDGPPPVAVPDVRDMSADQARGALAGAGLTVAGQRAVASARPAGTVLRTEPEKRASVARGTAVTLIVARPKVWRTVGTYSFDSDGQTPRFTIHGEQWRIRYTMDVSCSYESISPCIGTDLTLQPTFDTLDLSKGTHTTAIAAGPGRYYFEFSSQDDATLKLTVEERS